MGIPWDNPEMTKPEDCRYDACLIVAKDQLINHSDVKKGKTSEGEYAVFEIEHTAEAVEQAWRELFMEPSIHGYKMDDSKPIMERYANKMVENHKCEICVPIG
ncbi:MAG TPA: GyrI-like domain-containing protein [Acetobacterium sp.]